MVRTLLRLVTLFFVGLIGSAADAQQPGAAKPATEMTISEMMKECHKKPTQLLKKVATGKANQDEKQRLVEVYTALQQAKPPKGDDASWSERTGLLVAAATAAAEGKTDAQQRLTKASNCTACHDAHK